MVEHWFSSPVYYSYVRDNRFNDIQQELSETLNKLLSDGSFAMNSTYDGNDSHLVSDVSFSSCLINRFNLPAFSEELNYHINEFLRSMDLNKEFVIEQSWMTINRTGFFAAVHDHGGADISGVYYFKTNGKDGELFFKNQNNTVLSKETQVNYKPEIGKLILFPSHMKHGVTKNETDEERISVAFNVKFK